MTKTKTKKENSTTAKIKELTGVKPEKITDDQLKKVQDTVSELNRSQLEIGSIETRKHELLHGAGETRKTLANLQKDFQKEYGTFDININDGIINYPENGEVNS